VLPGKFGNVVLEEDGKDQKHLERFEMWCWRRMEKIRNTWKVLKCGAGGGWRRSETPGKL
jgi:hypothetical protein